MKRYLILISLLTAFVSCKHVGPETIPEPEPDPEVPVISPDSALVSLKASLDFTAEPLTKAGSSDDLYGIRVYQITGNGPIMTAYGTFDDLSKAVVKMAKAYKYGIDVTYIENGKNLVHKFSDGHYGTPFDAVWNSNNGSLNQVLYTKSGDQPVWPFTYGVVQEKGITDYMVQSNNWSSVTRYQGIAICNPKEQSTVDVKMYAQMVGFRIAISDFEKGSVTLGGTYGHKYTVKPDANHSALLDVVVCIELMPSVSEESYIYSQEDIDPIEYIYAKDRYHTVELIYNDGEGNDIVLYSNVSFYVKRNTRYTMSFSLSDAIRNGGITASIVDEGEMNEEDFPL